MGPNFGTVVLPDNWDELPDDQIIAYLAERQHGVVARRQLRRLGFEDKQISYRLNVGRLHRVHQGAFSVGHRKLTRNGRLMAAVLACGDDDAFLDAFSACEHWG